MQPKLAAHPLYEPRRFVDIHTDSANKKRPFATASANFSHELTATFKRRFSYAHDLHSALQALV